MIRIRPVTIIVLLVLTCLMGIMPMNMASHAADHVHHSATTHGTGVCAWMCAVAQGFSAESPIITHQLLPITSLELGSLFVVNLITPLFNPIRAPPI